MVITWTAIQVKRLYIMQKIWMRKSSSFQEAKDFDDLYYLSLTPSERLDIVQFLREEYEKFDTVQHDESRKRLRRVFSLIKQA